VAPLGDPAGEQGATLRAQYKRPPAQWPAPTLDAGIEHRELGPVQAREPTTDPKAMAREKLGELLFFDGRLSPGGQMACVSCHDAELGFADGRATSFGRDLRPLTRNAPSLLNTALRTNWFWDGRAASLEQQAEWVLTNPDEMHSSKEHIEQFLRSSEGYRKHFEAAFGPGEPDFEQALAALAAFEATFVSDGSSAFDGFLAGDYSRLDDSAVRGLHLFRTRARCLNCHSGPLLTDDRFHNLGLTYYGRKQEDLGRYKQTGKPEDVGRFRTPSLRNVERTAPYMHNGLFELDGVLNMYDVGMPDIRPDQQQASDPLFPVKSPHIQELNLSAQDKADLRAFLRSLTERKRRIAPPTLP
jgi:cytochrome c peroxidase